MATLSVPASVLPRSTSTIDASSSFRKGTSILSDIARTPATASSVPPSSSLLQPTAQPRGRSHWSILGTAGRREHVFGCKEKRQITFCYFCRRESSLLQASLE